MKRTQIFTNFYIRINKTVPDKSDRVEGPYLISIADVSRAYFYADAMRDVYVRLPDEDPKQSSQACVGNCERQCTDP